MSSTKTATIITIACILSGVQSFISPAYREYEFLEKTKFGWGGNMTEDGQVNVYAEVIDHPDIPNKSKCRIIIEEEDLSKKICVFDLPKNEISPLIVNPLGNNEVLIDYSYISDNRKSEPKVKQEIIVLNMENCHGKTMYLISAITSKSKFANTNAIAYKDHFEVFTTEEERCHSSRPCRVKYDYNGNMIGEPENFESTYLSPYTVSVDQYSSKYGFFQLKIKDDSEELSLIKPDGKQVILQNFFKFNRLSHSVVNQKFTTCSIQSEHQLSCTQYDADGRKTIDTVYNFPNAGKTVSVHNSKNGDLLVLTDVICTPNVPCSPRVARLNANGQLVKSFEVPKHPYNCIMEAGLNPISSSFETYGRVCFVMSCANLKRLHFEPLMHYYFSVGRTCVSKTDLEE